MTELRAFNGKFLSKHAAGTLKLKSFIHSIAEVPKHGQCALKPATLKYLHENDQGFVENMSGYEEKSWPKFLHGGRPEFGNSQFFKYSPELTNLFDPTVFQKFNFITLTT